MRKPTVTISKKKNYLAMIENAAKGENRMFQNLFATVDGKEEDIVDGGALSCAFFMSGILFLNKLIEDMHANLRGLEADLQRSGWSQTGDLIPGVVLIWEPQASKKERDFDPTGLHAGFYVGNNEAVSNDSNGQKFPVRHNMTYGGTRQVIRMYWHPILGHIG